MANMLSFVEFYQPRYVLMENVKGLLQHHSRGCVSDVNDEDGDKIVKMGIVKFVLRALTCLGWAGFSPLPLQTVLNAPLGIKLNSKFFKVSHLSVTLQSLTC